MIARKLIAYLLVLAFAISPARGGSITMPFPGPGAATGVVAIGTPVSIGTGTASSGTTLTMTTTGAIPSGSLALVSVSVIRSASVSVSSVSDGTNSYSLARSSTWDSNTFVVNEIWYKENAAAVSSSATITVTVSGAMNSGDSQVAAAYVTGIITASSLDKVNSASSGVTSTTTPASGSTGTLAQSNEIVFGVIGGYTSPVAAPVITESSGFTLLSNQTSTTRYFLHWGYRVVAATTAQNYQPTVTAYLGGDVIATFKGN